MRSPLLRFALAAVLLLACLAGWKFLRQHPHLERTAFGPPASPHAHYNRGNAYLAQKNYDMAIADFTQAIALTPNDPSAYVGRGLAAYFKGQRESAAADFRAALALMERRPPRVPNLQFLPALVEK